MEIVRLQNKVPVRLTDERWKHIVKRHPEMDNMRDKVLVTLSKPEMVQMGDFGELLAIRVYPRTPLTRKNLIVAYREISSKDGFILTAYLATRPSTRRIILWKQ
jgi:hypothetical protein